MKTLGCFLVAVISVLAFLFFGMLAPHVFVPPFLLIFGWTLSLRRYATSYHEHASFPLAFCLATAVLVLGTHLFLRWVWRTLQTQPAEQKRWCFRWTVAGFGIGGCALLAVSCVVLTTHQLYWLSKSEDPWFYLSGRNSGFFAAERVLTHAVESCAWNFVETRNAFFTNVASWLEPPVLEVAQPIWIEGTDGNLKAVILLPRPQPGQKRLTSFFVVEKEREPKRYPLQQLQQISARFGLEIPAPSTEESVNSK